MATDGEKEEIFENLENSFEENSLIFERNDLTHKDNLTKTYEKWNETRPIVAIRLVEEFGDSESDEFNTDEAALNDYQDFLEKGRKGNSPYMFAAAAQTAKNHLDEEKYVQACEELLEVVEPSQLDEIECAYQGLDLKDVIDESTWEKFQRENFYENLKEFDRLYEEKRNENSKPQPHSLINALKIAKENLGVDEYRQASEKFIEYVEENDLKSYEDGMSTVSETLERIGNEFDVDLSQVYRKQKKTQESKQPLTNIFRKEPNGYMNLAKPTSTY